MYLLNFKNNKLYLSIIEMMKFFFNRLTLNVIEKKSFFFNSLYDIMFWFNNEEDLNIIIEHYMHLGYFGY